MSEQVETMSRDDLEDEVLALRHKLQELVSRDVDWMDKVKLAPLQRRMMKYMLANLDRVCSKDAIHESLYDSEPESERKIVDVMMFSLRKRLVGSGYRIVTQWGIGFILEKTPNEQP